MVVKLQMNTKAKFTNMSYAHVDTNTKKFTFMFFAKVAMNTHVYSKQLHELSN